MRTFFITHKRLLLSLAAVLFVFATLQVGANFFFLYGFSYSFEAHGLDRLSFTQEPYYGFSICLGALMHPAFALPLIAAYAFIIHQKISFAFTYEHAKPVRWIIMVCAAILTWELITYDYNYYFDSAFHFDRILLLVLTVLLWRFPVLVPLFVACILVYRSQFNFPMDVRWFVDKRVLVDVLLLFTAWNLLRKYIALTATHFLILVFSLVASNYFVTGITKVFISPHGYEWMTQNNLGDLFYNANSRGWMRSMPAETVHNLGSFFDAWSPVFQWGTFLIELSMLFVLWRRKTAVVLLTCCLFMHTGIFIAGSMLFWKWMLLDATLIMLLFFKPAWMQPVFNRVHFRISLAVILLSVAWLRPTPIGWHDTPFNQFFTFEVTNEHGETHVLSRNDFDPYHQWFQLDAFTWLVNHPTLSVSGFGYTLRYKEALAIKKAGKEGIFALEKALGKNRYDKKQEKLFCDFIQTFFVHYNQRLHEPRPFWYYLHAPHHLYSSAQGKLYNRQWPIRQVRVIFVKTYREGDHVITLSRETCEVIDIPR